MSTCSICLSALQEPVSIPCGHIYCSSCLLEYVGASQQDLYTASCPTCRASFPIVSPELTLIPKQLHRFFVPGIRRVYIDLNLQQRLSAAQEKVKVLEEQCNTLMNECERHIALARAHSEGEQVCQKKLKECHSELKESQLEGYRAQRALSQERKRAVEAVKETSAIRERCSELEEELDSYRRQRQEDLDAIVEVDDLKRLLSNERKISKQAKREAVVWKEKYNESQEQLELYESKSTQPRLAKRSLSEESIDSLLRSDIDLSLSDEPDVNEEPTSESESIPLRVSMIENARRRILPPPRKKLRSSYKTRIITQPDKKAKEEVGGDSGDVSLYHDDIKDEVERPSPPYRSLRIPRVRLLRDYRLPTLQSQLDSD
ncbi:hypothetical protein K435DRAFT_749255 [Dendrothele bispora CBS 962.96]|uniref:RING-type domain-containing protein n=1 Tax=Dendrothele bispora (strain CBS 962.96) TaxID=1314807 RepID=A0A4S8MII1_DENBC|nr:hypothetical protein K435DRAFT_749255 [Dendrothele bispora CBS 962.96]